LCPPNCNQDDLGDIGAEARASPGTEELGSHLGATPVVEEETGFLEVFKTTPKALVHTQSWLCSFLTPDPAGHQGLELFKKITGASSKRQASKLWLGLSACI
jgi:hypothetical protein